MRVNLFEMKLVFSRSLLQPYHSPITPFYVTQSFVDMCHIYIPDMTLLDKSG